MYAIRGAIDGEDFHWGVLETQDVQPNEVMVPLEVHAGESFSIEGYFDPDTERWVWTTTAVG